MNFKKCSLRFCSIFLVLILALLYFSFKLVLIQFFRRTYLANRAEQQHNYGVTLEPIRGAIFDRYMRPLALNISVESLFANPRDMRPEDKAKALRELPKILNIDEKFLQERLSRRKYFIWLSRKLPKHVAQEIKELDIPGLGFIKESKRHYPGQYLASHVIGFAGVDNRGLEGMELLYDRFLKGQEGWSQVIRDARQHELLIEKAYIPPTDGFSLVLTIDETIQYIAEKALEEAFIKHNAKAASIVVMDPRTGEILAMANRPTYDLSQYDRSLAENRVNRSVAYVYEPGSVFKIVAASAALEEEVFNEDDKIFCENGAYRIANNILHDYHSYGTITFREVFEYSSNIGTTKVAQKLGPKLFYKYARRFRFGLKTKVDLIGEVDGWLKDPSQWSKTTIGAMPIGQEVTVTPLQLVCAISSIANDGVYMKPFVVKYIKDNNDELIKAFQPTVVDRVISENTAQRVKAILEGVVANGTGKKAQIAGIEVAGKTGTAQKVVNGRYSDSKFYATFIGFAPVEDPQLAAVVVFDEPHPNHFGGTVSAPVFREVVLNTLKYLEATQE